MKQSICCICHKKLDYKSTRLTKQEYGNGKYKQYYPVENYDICDKCYETFDRWIEKYKEAKK